MGGIRYLWPSNNHSLEKPKQTDKMMKTVLLLAFAVFVSSYPTTSSTPAKHSDKNLRELVDELTMKDVPKDNEGKPIFLTELQMDRCKHEFFCQAEQELMKKVSGLSGARFEHFRTDKKLMRNLNMYNKHHGKTCKPVDEKQDQIPLHDFLKNLLTCVKMANSRK